MPTRPFVPETLTDEGRDLVAEVWEGMAHRLPEGVVPPLPTPEERAEQAARDVGAADLGSLVAKVSVNKQEHTVSYVVDERTATALMYVARVAIAEYEAHEQELLIVADQFPAGSYGRANRLEQARREQRKSSRLRAVVAAYKPVVDKELWGM